MGKFTDPLFRAMRGAPAQAGEHRLVYRYDPASLKVGAGLTLAGIAALVLLLGITNISRNEKGPCLVA